MQEEVVSVENKTLQNQKQTEGALKTTNRIKSIDRFRGFCVFAMLIFQFLKNFPSLGILSSLQNILWKKELLFCQE